MVENAGGGSAATVGLFGDDTPLHIPVCDQASFKLYHTVPMGSNGWGYAGELHKWVPVNTARVRSIATHKSITARLSGTPGESTTVTFVNNKQAGDSHATLTLHSVQCQFGRTGTAFATPEGCNGL